MSGTKRAEVIRHVPELAFFVDNQHYAVIERDRLDVAADRFLQIL